MAKTPSLKKGRVNASVRSRAARRKLDSPPPDVSTLSSGPSYDEKPSILGPHKSEGISKKKPRLKVLSRKQRLRVEAGKERGENIREQTSAKILDSVGRSQRRNRRRRDWDETNQSIQHEVDAALRRRPSPSRQNAQLNPVGSASEIGQPQHEPGGQPVVPLSAQKLVKKTAGLSLDDPHGQDT